MIGFGTRSEPVSDRAFDHAAEAFGFIETLEGLSTTHDVMSEMQRAFALFGFENFIITGLPNERERFESKVLLRKWPLGWYELYARGLCARRPCDQALPQHHAALRVGGGALRSRTREARRRGHATGRRFRHGAGILPADPRRGGL